MFEKFQIRKEFLYLVRALLRYNKSREHFLLLTSTSMMKPTTKLGKKQKKKKFFLSLVSKVSLNHFGTRISILRQDVFPACAQERQQGSRKQKTNKIKNISIFLLSLVSLLSRSLRSKFSLNYLGTRTSNFATRCISRRALRRSGSKASSCSYDS